MLANCHLSVRRSPCEGQEKLVCVVGGIAHTAQVAGRCCHASTILHLFDLATTNWRPQVCLWPYNALRLMRTVATRQQQVGEEGGGRKFEPVRRSD